MRSPESLEELADLVGAEADQLTSILRSAFSVPPAIPPKERLEKFTRARRAATVFLGLRPKLDELQDAVDKGDEAEGRFVRAMRARGLFNAN